MAPQGPQYRTARGFRDTQRFRMERKLGEGAMGTVFLAYDRERDDWVALKRLKRLDANAVFHFKQEFRALCDLQHENVVRFYELFQDGADWFFTMEYVEGDDLLSHLHRDSQFALDERVADLLGPREGAPSLLPPPVQLLPPPCPVGDFDELAQLFLQVARALCAVHAAHKLHRDLKPDNVIVTPQGRVVLFDFGITLDQSPTFSVETMDGRIVGTPAYMSPEQARGLPLGPASDFYALGTMLYEALTGDVPFEYADPWQTIRAKCQKPPAQPSELVTGIPREFEQLCLSLLEREPERRPSGDEVCRGLERVLRGSFRPSLPVEAPVERALPFVGRDAELAELQQALASVDDGKPVFALLRGPSGIGKSTLVQHFVRKDAARAHLVLGGRCYERESVGFGGVDTVIDALAAHLRKRPRAQVAELLPRDLACLIAVFPVLGRVDVLQQVARRRRFAVPDDRQEVRRRAFAALKELLYGLAADRSLVLIIDDLQWADLDSAMLLAELLAPPQAPPLLLLCTHSDEAGTTPCLEALLRSVREHASCREITLRPLGAEPSAELGRELLPESSPSDIDALIREAQGSPHLLTEFARFVMAYPRALRSSQGGNLGVDQAIAARTRQLSSQARILLELLAVAGRPTSRQILSLASGPDADMQGAVIELAGHRLLRTIGARELGVVDVYHSRIREAVLQWLGLATRKTHHLALAEALEASGRGEAELLAHHFFEGGVSGKARAYAVEGATQAADGFAFDRAARLYQMALRNEPQDPRERRELRIRYAEALVLGGRRAAAAEVFLSAAEGASEDEAADLRRRAGQELVLGGDLERGKELLAEALATQGVELPETPDAALVSALQLRAELIERGLATRLRPASEIADAARRRLDTLWAASFGLGLRGDGQSTAVSVLHLREALELGDGLHVVRGLCATHLLLEVPLRQVATVEPLPLLQQASALASELCDPECDGWVRLVTGFEHYAYGRARGAVEELENAYRLFSERCTGAGLELGTCTQLLTNSLLWAHRWDELAPRAERWRADAEARDDTHCASILTVVTAVLSLMAGDVDRAVRLQQRLSTRTGGEFFLAKNLGVMIALSRGDVATCREYPEHAERILASRHGRLLAFRSETLLLRARCLTFLATQSDDPEPLRELAERDLAEVRAAGLEAMVGHVLLTGAALVYQRGDRAGALSLLDEALQRNAGGSEYWEAFLSWIRGAALGGEEGRALQNRSSERLRRYGFSNVEIRARTVAAGIVV